MFVSNLLVRSLQAESLHPTSDQTWLRDPQGAFAPGLHGREVDELVSRMLGKSGDADLGLTLGEHGSLSMLHVVSHLMLASRTARDALLALTEYAPIVLGGVEFSLEEDEEQVSFCFAPPRACHVTRRFWADFVLTFVLRVVRVHCGNLASSPRSLWLAHEEPESGGAYERVFGCRVLFDQDRYALVFCRASLDAVQAHADPVLETTIRDAARRQWLTSQTDEALLCGLRHALREEPDLTAVDFEHLAKRLGTDRRHLARRLAHQGHSCADLLDEARYQRALLDLMENQPIDSIAERLGFSKRSSFHRAFKRWTGKTPSQYRGSRAPRRARYRSASPFGARTEAPASTDARPGAKATA
jgi:AraC-like DNA-binding protein